MTEKIQQAKLEAVDGMEHDLMAAVLNLDSNHVHYSYDSNRYYLKIYYNSFMLFRTRFINHISYQVEDEVVSLEDWALSTEYYY